VKSLHWGSKGFDSIAPEAKLMRRLIGGLLKLRSQTNDVDNVVELAPSVAEADAILARFGYGQSEFALAV
jgi:hypothetical protein